MKVTFTQTELIKSFAKETNMTQGKSKELINSLIGVINKAFDDGKKSVDLLGFAKIKLVETAPKKGTLPFKSKSDWVKPKGFRLKLEPSKKTKKNLERLAKKFGLI